MVNAITVVPLEEDDPRPGETRNEEEGEDDNEESEERETQYVIPDNMKLVPIEPDSTEFATVPAVSQEKCPTFEVIRTELDKLGDGANFDITPKPLENGGFGYLLSSSWAEKLSHFLTREEMDSHPGPVDNSELFDKTGLQVKHNLSKLMNYKVLSKEQWELLMSWFGGGPSCKKLINQRGYVVTDYPVRVVCSENTSEYRRVLLPASMTLGEAKTLLCKLFKIDESKARMYDYFNNNPHASLEEPDVLVRDAKLVADNLILLEMPLKDGSYIVEVSSRRYRAPYRAIDREDKIKGAKPEMSGAVGLQNIGNTCYMNSMLQCLSNVPMLRQYFVEGKYKDDINTQNVLGYQGKLAKAFGKLMVKMWDDSGSVLAPYGFKRVISEIKPEFAGYQQHDSQELLSAILDGLHEDLNRIYEKPPTEGVVANGRPDEEVAVEAFKIFKQRNDSKIVDIFTGLFKSTVKCPDVECGNISVTFDPYMVLPLPLKGAEEMFQQLHIIYIPENNLADISNFNITVPKHGPVFIMRNAIAEFKEVPASKILLTKVKRSKVHFYFKDHEDIAEISASDTLVVYEHKFAEEAIRNNIEYDYGLSKWRRSTRYGNHSEMEDDDSEEDSDYATKPLASLDELDTTNKRQNEQDLSSKEKTSEESSGDDRIQPIGYMGCPWVEGDIWMGNYQFEDSPQIVRIEVEKVEKIEETKFKVQVIFDTKLDVQEDREKWFPQTSFQAWGIYTLNEVKTDESKKVKAPKGASVNRTVSNLFSRSRKKSANPSSKNSASPEEESTPFNDDCLRHGVIEFEPVGEPEFFEATRPSAFNEGEEEREPLAVQGSVDLDHARFWGSVKNSMGFLRGEIFMYRLFSRNWNTKPKNARRKSMGRRKKVVEDELFTISEMPQLLDGRPDVFYLKYYFISMAHRKEIRTYGHQRIDRYVFVPFMTIVEGKDMTEEQFFKYVLEQFKPLMADESSEKCDKETLKEKFDLVRASYGFETTSSRRARHKSLNIGEYIECDSDDKLVLGNDGENLGFVHITIHWNDECPFAEAIRTELLEVPNIAESMDINYALQIFGKEEKLNAFNSWYCRKCKQHQEAFKKIEIWSTPPVLVVQFKRFSQEEGRNRADKLETLVEFPTENFSLEKYVLSKESRKNCVYDLLAVSCHYGALGMGHYTAYARNENDGAWYKFDDHRVIKLEGEEAAAIADPSAYVLFYIRKEYAPESWQKVSEAKEDASQNAKTIKEKV